MLVIERDVHLTGLLVDAVRGMQQFAVDTRRDINSIDPALGKFAPYGFDRDGKEWPVFQLRELIQAPEFLQIAV